MKNDIVITQMSCIFPGASNVSQYWNNILEAKVAEKSSICDFWNIDESKFYTPPPGENEKSYLKDCFFMPEIPGCVKDKKRQIVYGNYVLEQLFANLSLNTERSALVLGTSWADTSYFDADLELMKQAHFEKTRGDYYDPGLQIEAYKKEFHIKGPSFAVDTACSSSLYALSNAIDLLKTHQIDSAIILGLNAFIPPFLFIGFSKIQALSPTGQILPFSRHANGIVPAEGVGAILIETEENALKNKRIPLARICSQGLSADGGERSLFAPGPKGMQLAWQRAYGEKGSFNIKYIEAHGTGTNLGDFTEVSCMREFFKAYGASPHEIALGSVKSLIGHPLAAAGIASIIKAVLMLQNRIIPQHLKVEPLEEIKDSVLYIPESNLKLDNTDEPMQVAVNSLGFGGANAHLILEEYHANRKSTVSFARSNSTTYEGPIAIIDEAFVSGSSLKKETLGEKLASGDSKAEPFPFPQRDLPIKIKDFPLSLGNYLSGDYKINPKNVRMGPAQAARMDPYLLMFSELNGQILHRNKVLQERDNGAIVFCTNIGGNTISKVHRKYSKKYERATEGKDAFKPEDINFNMETMLSCQPFMLSGVCAAAQGIRGFHSTISGGDEIVSSVFSLLPTWFGEKCDFLLLGAGSFIKNAADFLTRHEFVENKQTFNSEAMISLALCKEDLVDSKEEVIAWIEEISPLSEETEAHLIQKYAIPEAELSRIEYRSGECFIDGIPALPLFGYLAEASGIEPMLAALSGKKKYALIKLYDSKTTLIIRKNFDYRAKINNPSPKDHLIQISFGTLPLSVPKETVPKETVPKESVSTVPKKEPQIQSSCAALTAFYQENADLVTSILDSRFHLLSSLLIHENTLSPSHPSELEINRKVENIVIEKFILHKDSTNLCESHLVVNEDHKYFFDHPLDHLPGILLLEGALQTLERLLGETNEPLYSTLFFKDLDIKFIKYAEKNLTTNIIIKKTETLPHQYLIELFQNHELCCAITVVLMHLKRDSLTSINTNSSVFREKADQSLLHKKRDENILTSEISKDSSESYSAFSLVLPPQHFFQDGAKEWLSPIYLLEIARQGMMQISHLVLNIPLSTPMNLFSIKLKLDLPIPRNIPIKLNLKKESFFELNNTLIAKISTTFSDDSGRIFGSILIGGQVINKEYYAQIRRH